MILRITRAKHIEAFVLDLTFSDGVHKQVDVRPLLTGPVFQPLLEADCFARVALNLECGTVVWPNGADFAPEALHELPAISNGARRTRKTRVPGNRTSSAARSTRSAKMKA